MRINLEDSDGEMAEQYHTRTKIKCNGKDSDSEVVRLERENE